MTFWEGFTKRWKEIRAIHQTHRLFYWLLGGAIVVLTSLWVGILLFHGREDRGFEMNVFTEALGVAVSILITVLVINVAYERRDKKRLRVRLRREAGSRANAIAISAVEWIRAESWLEGDGGLLKGVNLCEANLQGANLEEATLQGTKLIKANLQGADLNGACLEEAKLFGANLQKAKLYGTNLQHAILQNADLRKAEMSLTRLGEAQQMGVDVFGGESPVVDLQYANLEGAYLESTYLHYVPNLHGATLPDGTRFTKFADIRKFTDPDHPEFKVTLEKIDRIRLGKSAIASRGPYVISDDSE